MPLSTFEVIYRRFYNFYSNLTVTFLATEVDPSMSAERVATPGVVAVSVNEALPDLSDVSVSGVIVPRVDWTETCLFGSGLPVIERTNTSNLTFEVPSAAVDCGQAKRIEVSPEGCTVSEARVNLLIGSLKATKLIKSTNTSTKTEINVTNFLSIVALSNYMTETALLSIRSVELRIRPLANFSFVCAPS